MSPRSGYRSKGISFVTRLLADQPDQALHQILNFISVQFAIIHKFNLLVMHNDCCSDLNIKTYRLLQLIFYLYFFHSEETQGLMLRMT